MITNINVGLTANDGLGDKLRNAFIIVNDNFDAIDVILTGTNSFTISQVQGLQTALTNINNQIVYIPGLQSDINDINNTIYTINQTLNNQNTSIADLYNEITNLQNQIYTKIEEAPIDGVTYGRKDGAWVVVTGGGGTLDLDGVLANGDTAIDKEIHINNIGASVTATITPSYINLTNGSSTNTLMSNSAIVEDGNSGLRTSVFPNIIEFWGGATQYLKGNPAQNASFLPSFYLPAKNLTTNWTLATTADYTLQNVTALNNTTNNGIQFQPILNTGTGSKYVTVQNNQVYLFSQSEGYSTITNDKILWSRFGNVVSLSGWAAAGSNSANYILPTKTFATYTLATTADILVAAVVSGNTDNLNVVSAGTTRILYSRGLTSSNQTISITATGSSTSSTYAWDAKVNPNLVLDSLTFNTASTATVAVGRFVWNDTDGTLDLGLKGGNVTLQVGQETVVRVVNKTATNITLQESAYQAVRITGAQGNRLKVDLAIATNDLLSAETIGLVTETILNNQEGFITTSGLIRGINTTGSLQSETWIDGDVLYLSPTTAGNITNIKPIAPNHLVIIGYVVRAHITQGQIFVKVDNGYELDELHNVKIIGATAGQVLTYNGTSSLWENKPLYSPVFNDVTNVISATATTGTIARTGDIALYGSTRYYRTLTSTSSTIGSIWGHVDNGQGASGFVSMFSNGPNFGVVNAFNGSYASASTTEAQLTFCAIKNTAYAKWTDNRLLFRFQNGYYTNDKIIDIGTNYIQFYGYTSSRVDTGFTPINYLTTDDLGVLKSRPITDLGLSFNATQRLSFLKI